MKVVLTKVKVEAFLERKDTLLLEELCMPMFVVIDVVVVIERVVNGCSHTDCSLDRPSFYTPSSPVVSPSLTISLKTFRSFRESSCSEETF